jgi:hypothetical protein
MASSTGYKVGGKDVCGSVRDKVPAIFVVVPVVESTTQKSGRHGPALIATPEMTGGCQKLIDQRIPYRITGKIDGTSTIVHCKDGVWYLYKRRDLKPGRTEPDGWVGTGAIRDGHHVGYMPLTPIIPGSKSKACAEYHSVFITDHGIEMVKVLRFADIGGVCKLRVHHVTLESLAGKSLELVGQKVQSDPHGISKHVESGHVLIEHGIIGLSTCPDSIDAPDFLDRLKEWCITDPVGIALEGIVVHFATGQMFKLTKHHLALPWKDVVPTPIMDIVF